MLFFETPKKMTAQELRRWVADRIEVELDFAGDPIPEGTRFEMLFVSRSSPTKQEPAVRVRAVKSR